MEKERQDEMETLQEETEKKEKREKKQVSLVKNITFKITKIIIIRIKN